MTTAQKREVCGAWSWALLLCLALTAARGQQNAAEVLVEQYPDEYEGHAGPVEPPGYDEVVDDLRQNYAESMANDQFKEATVIAKQLVEVSLAENGRNNLDTATALSNLGSAQYNDEEYDAAILNFRASIRLFERLEDNLSARLIEPLSGLGHSELAKGRPDLAVESFEHAVHINNVNEGPMNPQQVELLEVMADAFAAAGQLERATLIFDRIYQINARAHGADTAEILPTLQKRATWSHRHGLFHEEQDLYRRMIRITDGVHGRNDLTLIAPLTGLAYSYLYADSTWRLDRRYLSSIASGESFLKRALRIAQEDPNATWQHERDALLAIADFYLFASDVSAARRRYREAWELLSADEQRLSSRATHLEQPVRLQLASPPQYVTDQYDENTPPEILNNREYHRGYIIAEFDVTVEGRSAGIRIVAAQPADFNTLQKQVVERIERAVYRPRHDHGYPVRSRKIVYRHDFYYLTSDLSVELR